MVQCLEKTQPLNVLDIGHQLAQEFAKTARSYDFDRYWRNLRTATLHDLVDYKIREVGNWALTGTVSNITLYS